jgi:hypothetical protein
MRCSQRAAELGEDRQIGVQPHPPKAEHTDRQERPVVLEPPELALDGATDL